MALLQANGEGVIEGSLSLVSAGRSVAELFLESAEPNSAVTVGQPVTLKWQDGTLDLMTCTRAGPYRGLWRVLLVGGSCGLSKELRPKYYSGIAASSVAGDLLSEVGETPGPLRLSGALERYVRQAGPAHEALNTLLLLFPDLTWRVTRSGLTQIDSPSWPDDSRELDILDRVPADGMVMLRLDQSIDAGVTLPSLGRVDRVTHWLGREELRTEVYLRD